MIQRSKAIATSLIGNVIEYYGFTVFAVFAPQIGQTFFPTYNPFLQVLLAQMLFGSGFISRPLGSLVFGHFGDKIGRKRTLSYTMLGMAFVTCLIGFIPGYNSIGIAAPILILILRLMQGFFVGGEGPGAALYCLEQGVSSNKGLIGGIIISSIVFGAMLANLVGLTISEIYGINNFNWRLSFFIGGAIGLVGLYLRFSLPETSDFIEAEKSQKILKLPIIEVVRSSWRRMIVIASLGGLNASISYTIIAYLVVHLKQNLKFPESQAMFYSFYSLSMYAIMLILIGKFSNRYDFKSFLRVICIVIILLMVIAFKAINSSNIFILFIGLTSLPVLSAAVCAPAYPYIYKMFRTEIRYSGVAVSYTLGITIFGGFSPAISTYLNKVTGLNYAAAFYIMTLAAVYLLSEKLFATKEEAVII